MTNHNDDLTMRGPVLIHSIGTSGNIQVRHFNKRLVQEAGGEVEFVKLFSVDGTGQVARPDLPMLGEYAFFNAAEDPQTSDRMRRAMRSPRVREYFPPKAAHLAAGDGAGAIPGAARFLLEDSYRRFVQQVTRQVSGFQPGQRPALAERARQSAWLRQQKSGITVDGAIEVYVVTAMNGGMAAALPYSTILLRSVLKKLGIPAKWKLILTPTAADCGETPDDLIKKSLAFARFSELQDYHAGREVRWPVSESCVIEDAGPFFEMIYLMPEPSKHALDAQRRFVGDFLFDMITPLGKAVNDKSVDKVRSSHQLGPHGTPALLHLVGGSTLQATAFEDVAGFAYSELGMHALECEMRSAREVESRAGEIVDSLGLTRGQLDALRAKVAVPEVPEGLPPQKLDAFLTGAGRRALSQATAATAANYLVVARALATAGQRLRQQLAVLVEQFDPAFAAEVSRAVSQQLNGVLAYVRELSTRATGDVSASECDPQRCQAIATAASERAFRDQLLRKILPQLEPLVTATDTLDEEMQQLARITLGLQREFQDRSTRYSHAAKFAVLDRTALARRIGQMAPKVAAEARGQLAKAILESTLDGARKDFHRVVHRHARSFEPLGNLDEALREAGEEGARAFTNALDGAAPVCRVDPDWDASNVSRHLFLTLAEDHPQSRLVAATGREVNFVRRAGTGHVRIVRIDFNHEISALAGVAEAWRAFLLSSDDFPAFADKNFEPEGDVLVPSPDEWYTILTLALHAVLDSGVVRYDKVRGRYFWRDVPLGGTRAEASRVLLADTGRLPGLPTREAMANEVEQLLFQGRSRDEAVAILDELVERLNRHLASRPTHAIRQTLYRERASARGLIARLRARLEDDAKEAEFWFEDGEDASPAIRSDETIVAATAPGRSRHNGHH